jgi:hypothetical protein
MSKTITLTVFDHTLKRIWVGNVRLPRSIGATSPLHSLRVGGLWPDYNTDHSSLKRVSSAWIPDRLLFIKDAKTRRRRKSKAK